MTGSVPPNTAIVAAIACSTLAVAALTELVPLDVRARRVITALTVGHGVAAAIMLAGLAPSIPRSLPLIGLAAAGALGVASRAALGLASTASRQPQPLTMAPRVAAIALVVQALLHRWADAPASLSMPLHGAIFLAIAALGVAQLASLSIVALRVPRRWAIAGLLAWTVGWVATSVDLTSLIVGSLGGPPPPGPQELRRLDPELVQILTTAGGLLIGAALVTSIRDSRFRHSAVVLLAGYAAFGLIAAVTLHRIELAADFPSIVALRENGDLADAITAFALAGVLWLYWRRVVASRLPRATTRDA
ncbi:MAG TPA: hypothetical protein VHW23_19530 [Kofleriaceae bacterium]|nr:hypothetical protein [Kofleriaceae bacterium]